MCQSIYDIVAYPAKVALYPYNWEEDPPGSQQISQVTQPGAYFMGRFEVKRRVAQLEVEAISEMLNISLKPSVAKQQPRCRVQVGDKSSLPFSVTGKLISVKTKVRPSVLQYGLPVLETRWTNAQWEAGYFDLAMRLSRKVCSHSAVISATLVAAAPFVWSVLLGGLRGAGRYGAMLGLVTSNSRYWTL